MFIMWAFLCEGVLAVQLADHACYTAVTSDPTNVKAMDCSSQGLTGPIPAALGDLSLLTSVKLNDNAFTGQIPAALGKLTDVHELRLQNNQLTGCVPCAGVFLRTTPCPTAHGCGGDHGNCGADVCRGSSTVNH